MIDYSSVINNMTNQYNATVQGYQNTLNQQQQAQQGVMQGYNSLQANVLGGLAGQSDVSSKQIAQQYTAALGKTMLSNNARGLGNTTIQNNAVNWATQSQQFAQEKNSADFAQMAADKSTQLGLAGLGYAGNALNANMNFAGQGLQYQGQGAAQIGQLAQGFAGYENQAAMQQSALAQQQNLQNQQLAQQKAMQQAEFSQQYKMALLGQSGRGGAGSGGIQYAPNSGGGSYPHDPGGSPSYATVPTNLSGNQQNANAATFGYGSQAISPSNAYAGFSPDETMDQFWSSPSGYAGTGEEPGFSEGFGGDEAQSA